MMMTASAKPVFFDTGVLPSENYFQFEQDFIQDQIRCIPMLVRYKLDAAGIKLRLKEWTKMLPEQRNQMLHFPWNAIEDVLNFRKVTIEIIHLQTGNMATMMETEPSPCWANTKFIPLLLQEKLNEFGWSIDIQHWEHLSNLQRFVLVKLSRPSHENSNFPIAVREFGIL